MSRSRQRSGLAPAWRSERGQVTAAVVILTTALLLAAGLTYDGGLILAAKRQAINEAEAAARAGAQALDIDSYRGAGTVRLDPAQATALASGYLAATGHAHTIQPLGDDRISVTVTITQPLTLLGLAGLGSQTVTGQATARAAHGVEEAAP